MFFLKLILTFMFSLLFIKLVINYSKVLNLVDIPNERSSHTTVTPRGAGIGFGLSFFLVSIIVFTDIFIDYWLVYLSIFIVFIVGIVDDVIEASPKLKFYAIFIAVLLLYIENISIFTLGEYFSFEVSLWYFALPFSMFAIAGFTNALNLIDGLDALATTVSIVILSSFLYIGIINNDELIILLCSLNIVALLAFLIYNWNPASIFMGDSGSLFLGFIISIVAVVSLKYIHPIAVFYLAAVPIVDTIVVMTRRIKKGISPFSPDKTHIHHILLKFFSKKVKKTVLFLALMQALFSLTGVFLAINSNTLGNSVGAFIALIGFVGITLFFYMILTGMMKRQKLIERLSQRKKRGKKNND